MCRATSWRLKVAPQLARSIIMMQECFREFQYWSRSSLRPATVLAPMAGVTDTVFRRLIRTQGGCGLIMTEFTSSHGVVAIAGQRASPTRTFRYLYFDPEEHPISAQLFGSDPQVMADAARHCQDLGFDIVDINFGCPVKKVVKCNGGSGLLRDLPLVEQPADERASGDLDSADHEIPRRLERSGTGDGPHGEPGRGLRPAGRRAASAHARAGLQRQSRLDAHRRSEGRGENSRDRQWRHPYAGRRGAHGARDRLRRRDDRPGRIVESMDFPPDSAVCRDRRYDTPSERDRYDIMRSYYAHALRSRRRRTRWAR